MNNIAPGQQIGPYRIINQIGQGGMATVYKAYHAAMDRYVAVKVLPSQFAQNKEFTQRFEQEARTIAKLEHAHILPVYDYGEDDGITYLVMRYLDAGTLKDRIQRGDLSLTEADKLFTQLAGALAYAHEMNVIHRDIKPSNAMVNSRGELFLTDFGIAKLLESTAQFTATGAITGTPAYMSPEQAQGDKLDARSDIYSLGIVLYEMVTGRVPFEAETPLAVILKHINAPLPPPTALKPDLPSEIEQVILKALAKNRDDRFATCDEFLNAWKIALTQTQTARVMTPSMDEMKAAAPTLAASPTITAAPAAVKVPLKKKPSRALAFIGVGALVLISLCVGALSIHWYNQNQVDKQLTAAAAVTPPPQPSGSLTLQPTSTPVKLSPTQAPAAPASTAWTSWVAVNNIRALALRGDVLVAGTGSGFSFWSLDGKLIEHNVSELPNPRIHSIFVDTDGTIWLGTGDGLVHLVGERREVFGQREGLGGTEVNVIARVGKRLLVGTSYSADGGGLYEFDNGRFKTMSFPSAHEDQKGKLSYNVTAIAGDKKNNLWVGTTNGLGRYDGKNWIRFGTEKGLPHLRITSLLTDERDGVLVGTEEGVAFIEGDDVRVMNEKFAVYGIAYDNKPTFWFPSSSSIARFDPVNRALKFFNHTNADLPPDVNFTSVAKGEDGTLYFGSEVGIVRYGSDGKFMYWQKPNVPMRASYDRVLDAPDGLLWFVEQHYINVDRFDPATQKWSPLLPPLCGCVPLAFDAAGNMWASEWDQGLWVVNKRDKINVSLHQGLPSNIVLSVAFPKEGAAWVGTEKGLALLRDQQKVERVFNKANAGLADDAIRALLVAADKTVWVGVKGGLSHLRADDKWEHFTVGDPFEREMGEVTGIAQAKDGSIWVATSQSGAYQLKDGKWLRFTPRDPGVKLPSLEVRRIIPAPDGSVWFATPEGAARFDGKEWIRFRAQPNELVGEMVNDIFVSKTGEVYFATGAGVSRWKP